MSRLVLPPAQYRALCYIVYDREGWRCKLCKSRNGLQCHHIVFRSHQGPDASWNLLTVCNDCHNAIHAGKVTLIGLDDGRIDADIGVRFIYHGWTPKRRG